MIVTLGLVSGAGEPGGIQRAHQRKIKAVRSTHIDVMSCAGPGRELLYHLTQNHMVSTSGYTGGGELLN